jgi:hypothetical protein
MFVQILQQISQTHSSGGNSVHPVQVPLPKTGMLVLGITAVHSPNIFSV